MAAAAQSVAVVADDPTQQERARRIVADIGETIIDDDLRTSFLQRWSELVVLASG